jgi:subtilisin family serine protease
MGGSINPETMNAVKAAEEEDVVIVASAGNKPDDFTVIAPAFLESIVAVGAIDETGKKAAISVSGAALDLMAPGEKVAGPWIRGGYNVGSGTSDSAAIVSGAAALIRSKYPNMSAAEVVDRLESTAIDKGAPGVDPDYGHGIIDIVAALSDGAASTAPSATPTSAAAPVPTTTTSAASPETEPASSNTPLIAGAAAVLAVLAGLAAFLILRRRASPSP